MGDLLFRYEGRRVRVKERDASGRNWMTLCDLSHEEAGKVYAWLGYVLHGGTGKPSVVASDANPVSPDRP